VGEGRYSVEVHAGRLVEARVFELRTREDVDAYSHELGVQVLRMPLSMRPVLCADHRPVGIYPQAAADRLAELFAQMNARLERVAILAARSNATLVLQLDRIIREANNPSRRMFHNVEEAEAHLAPVLSPSELGRMRDFLDDWSPASRLPPSSRRRI
jgi:hypothetical protein